ncbi:DUF4344 domain-containing metallopeptidase [Devosia sp.]|uniref:DUF4344 domain-containing metallopeptidase n=1 Tax=Devosia sp. TaxID=1871048 RepID=UPI0025F220D7|nr:DUF4344 domain-containing metallopeptidase [Devosia sp.]MCR6633794.1 DUF4344 domain-containing metallopeptidase [Devosia sp.]
MISLRKTAAVSVCLALLAAPAMAQDEDQVLAESMDFAMHDALYTMYHEVGHMLVGELELPVLGKEEDAADALATIWLLTDETDDDSWNALIDAADGWYFNAVQSTGSGVEDFSYYDDHSLDIQRAYAMVCMMVGAEPDVFGETADNYEIDAEQQEACAYTYEQAVTSWDALLEPHLVDGEQGAEIEIVYEDAGDYEVFAEEMKARGILEHAAKLVMDWYVLPETVTFRATQCGEANAYFYPAEREITYCYELAEHMFYLHLYDIVGWSDTAE